MFLRIFQHLLPQGRAWKITINKQLRQFFDGLGQGLGDPAKLFIDQVWEDLNPQKTRELDLWEDQFALVTAVLSEQERRDRLEATWKAKGGQDPRYIEDTLQAAGFDVYVHEWWVPGTEPAVNVSGAATARDPFDYLNDNITPLEYISVDNGADMQDGDLVGIDIASEDIAPTGIFFKSDGTKMYMVGNTNDTVYQYSLPIPWSLSGASYDSVSFSVASEDVTPTGIFFKSDGTKMYVMGGANDTVYQYTLPIPWVLTGASYDSVLFSVASEDIAPTSLFFKSDGTKMYMVGNTNDTVYQYTLSTPWVLTGASYDSVLFSVASEDVTPQGIFFKDDGSKMYMVGADNDNVFQYSLHTPWVLTGMSYDGIFFSIVNEDTAPTGIFFKDNGTKMYMVGTSTDSIYQYTLPTSWLLTGAWYDTLAEDGLTIQPSGYPLVNKILEYNPDFIDDGAVDMQDGDDDAQDGFIISGGAIYKLKQYVIPADTTKYPYFLYIGGETFPDQAVVDGSRKNEFETLCLKICPTEQWLGILVNYS